MSAVLILMGGLVAQWAVQTHLAAAGPVVPGELVHPLADLPLVLDQWVGEDRPITDQRVLYGDEHLQRSYRHRQTGQVALVWMAYSRTGADRGHHPEVCMAVAGRPEDRTARQTIPLPGHPAPVQEYRFGAAGDEQWVHYWYYTLPSQARPDESLLQRGHRQLRQRPASLTLEVFAPTDSAAGAEGSRELVALLDAAIQSHVGSGARRGSQRLPVVRIERPE